MNLGGDSQNVTSYSGTEQIFLLKHHYYYRHIDECLL